MSPFDVPGVGRGYLRLRPTSPSGARGQPRAERLREAVARGDASMQFEVRRAWHRRWVPAALVTLRAPVAIDQDRLRFWPFRAGRGVVPRGAVHALRRGAYTLSQWARP